MASSMDVDVSFLSITFDHCRRFEDFIEKNTSDVSGCQWLSCYLAQIEFFTLENSSVDLRNGLDISRMNP